MVNHPRAGQVNTKMPSGPSIGAFAYAREADTNYINTVVLYQETSGALSYVWQDSSSPWHAPASHKALANADSGTDIACLTQQGWSGRNVKLSNSTDMNRCFFQRGGALWQVRYDGKDWKDLNAVPLK